MSKAVRLGGEYIRPFIVVGEEYKGGHEWLCQCGTYNHVEVVGNKLLQARGASNRTPTKEERSIIKSWLDGVKAVEPRTKN